MIRYLLFDLDNTLYPATTGLGDEMDKRMTDFVANHLSVSPVEARALRRQNVKVHGSTLRWLSDSVGVDMEQFLEVVHPSDPETWIGPEQSLAVQETLSSINMPASILTNSPREHAERVLRCLGVQNRFEHLFDLRWSGFTGKPARIVYERALESTGMSADETLLVDDVLQYLLPFRRLGGHVVQICAGGRGGAAVPCIETLHELVPFLGLGRSS